MRKKDSQDPANTRADISDADRQEKLARLVECRSQLSPEQALLLNEFFKDIFDAHYDLVWDYLRRRGLDRDDAEDLLQEAFIALHNRILEKGFPNSIPGLLMEFAEGKLLNHLRGNKRSPFSNGLPSSGSERPKSSGLDLDRILDLRDLSQYIFGLLSPDQQDVAEKVLINGLTYSEAAGVLGIPEATLKNRLVAAKRTILALAEELLTPSQRALL